MIIVIITINIVIIIISSSQRKGKCSLGGRHSTIFVPPKCICAVAA